jgi:hypothetical protein
MYDPSNPYASPMATEMNPVAVDWLGTPSASLYKVANGLGLIYYGVIVMAIAIGGGTIIGAILGATSPNPDPNVIARRIADQHALFLGIMLVSIGGRLLGITGSLFCLATPAETGAQGFIFTSVATMGGGVGVQLAVWLGFVSPRLELLQHIFYIVSGATFLLFLRRLAQFTGRDDLAEKAKSVLMWCGVLLVLIIGIILVPLVNGRPIGRNDGTLAILGILGLVLLIGGLVVFVRYANLVNSLRKHILIGSRA